MWSIALAGIASTAGGSSSSSGGGGGSNAAAGGGGGGGDNRPGGAPQQQRATLLRLLAGLISPGAGLRLREREGRWGLGFWKAAGGLVTQRA